MKKSILLAGAVPLVFGVIGYGVGLALKPADATRKVEAASGHATAEDVLDRLAEDAPQPPEAETPVLHKVPGDDANAEPKPAHDAAAAAPAVDAAHGGHEMAAAGEHAAPAADDAHGGHDVAAAGGSMDDTRVVQVGQISVPVYKPHSVTYVVAEFGVAVENDADVRHYSIDENATRLRDAILTSMQRVAETPMLKGPAIDSDKLAETVAADLKPEFDGVKDVLFLTLHKTDVPRS